MNYLIRIIVLPFWLIVALIYMVYELILKSILFVQYGGEVVTYEKEDRVTIYEIYNELKKEKL